MPTTFGFDGINATRSEIAGVIAKASAGWAILFCLAEGVRSWRDDLQAGGAKYDTCLAWVKPDAMPRFNGQGAARGFECAVTAWCGRGYRSWNGGGRRGIFTHCVNTNRDGEHPTEKPLPLMVELVDLFTQRDELVADPYMGSGTTGVAALRLGRKFIGIEIEPRYFDIALRRIEAEHRRPRLDLPEPISAPKQEALL